ncbi:hypothetical protein Q7P37_004311 [Cladosporium fusiforme]
MASRPSSKQEHSFGPSGDAYETQSYGGEAASSAVDGKTGIATNIDEDQCQLKGATVNDQHDMRRLGKTQELRRSFRFLSIFGYSLLLGNGWVLSTIGLIAPLSNGGSAGAIWIYLIVIVGMVFSTLSMAEMASMAPTAGGQYHWVSEFAPKQHQQFLSYMTGWLSVLGWQTALVSTAYSAALAVQGMIALNNPGYAVPAWHGVLLTVGAVLTTIIFNTVLLRKLPALESGMLVLHVFAFLAIFIVLWVMGDKAPAEQVFMEFSDPQGWGSNGVAALVGSLAATGSLLGSDSAVHLGEELQDASLVLPRSMITCAATNYSLTLLMVITLLVVKGGDVEQLIETPYVQPYVQIFYNVTQSTSASTALTALIFALLMFGIINQVTTTSRQLWSFARDRGLPWSDFLSRVRPGWDIPLNAVVVTLAFSIVVSMIILGSPVAFFTLGSLCQSGLALSFQAVFFVFMFFPVAPNPTAPLFNWTLVVFGVVVLWAVGYYHVHGKKNYAGPVMYVRRSYQ